MSGTSPLSLFSVFHLNLAYSSVEESERPDVVRLCYRPLLRLALERRIPLAIETTGFTLEAIHEIDPGWIDGLRRALEGGCCELIGSGYAQIIGPLVPVEVNHHNQRLGRETYRRLLGVEPGIALVNEQAWSPGLVPVYRRAGYRAVIMEWDNPSRGRDDWRPAWRYLPQAALSQDGERVTVLWNQSIAFQKLQRYAHGELTLDEHVAWLASHAGPAPRVFSAYGNDAEVFGYRPGRFATEPRVLDDEWDRLERLYDALARDPRFEPLLPSRALARDWGPESGHGLRLESPGEPIPVKKQGKYNITRWALTGRDDLALNTGCHRVRHALADAPDDDPRWRELCLLWSSDLRTHITDRRWNAARERLRRLEAACGVAEAPAVLTARAGGGPIPERFRVDATPRRIDVETPSARLALLPRRGLALARFATTDDPTWRFGTLEHGYFSDIRWSADFYTGHLVFEGAGRPKVTDLEPVEAEIVYVEDGDRLEIRGTAATPLGPVRKRWILESGVPDARLEYRIDWSEWPPGRLRLGHLTLNPEAFDRGGLFYRTHNGGPKPETHGLSGVEIDHSEAVSFLVSSAHVLGMTGGWVEAGDGARTVRLGADPTVAAVLPMVTLRDVAPSWFFRIALSAREMDDTSRDDSGDAPGRESRIVVRYTAV